MWSFNQKRNELITISLTPQNLTCSWIARSKGKKATARLKAYTRIPIKQFEFSQAVLFNPTRIKHHITAFIQEQQGANIPVALSVSGPKVFEKIIHLNTASPTAQEFGLPELQTLNWDATYLCPSQRSGFDFFVCGIKPEHLFSYQLLALSADINLVTIATEQLAYLQLYKHLRGDTFRQSTLSMDLLAQRYNPHSLCNADTVEDALAIDHHLAIDVHKEYSFLGTCLGLFLSEGKV